MAKKTRRPGKKSAHLKERFKLLPKQHRTTVVLKWAAELVHVPWDRLQDELDAAQAVFGVGAEQNITVVQANVNQLGAICEDASCVHHAPGTKHYHHSKGG